MAAASHDDDAASSDIDIPEPPATLTNRGAASLAKIFASAEKDRKTSKIAAKSLVFTAASPCTQANVDIWACRFNAFRQFSLHLDLNTTPTSDQIVRFAFAIVDKVAARNIDPSNITPSFDTLAHGLKYITIYARFRYPDFDLGSHGMANIASTLNRLLKEKKISKDPSRKEKMWITSRLVYRFISAMLRDALAEGTLSWDYLLMQVTALCWTSALACRVGDLLRTNLYNSLECVLYKDVALTYAPDNQGKHILHAVVTLRYMKGFKNDGKANHVAEFTEVTNAAFNVVCPIKLLLIHALRIGAVPEASWDEMLNNAKRRQSGRIVWEKPEYPVFCLLARGAGYYLDYESPANSTLLMTALRQGAQLAGILSTDLPSTHDIRRGAGRELAHLDKSLPGTNNEAARKGLGHSNKTQAAGVTDNYTGSIGIDTWKLRLEAAPLPGRKHKIDFADEPPPRKRLQRSSAEITKLCRQQGLDPARPGNRSRAGKAETKREWKAWVAKKEAQRNEPQADDPSTSDTGRAGGIKMVATPGVGTMTQVPHVTAPSRQQSKACDTQHPSTSGSEYEPPSEEENEEADKHQDQDIPIDPELQSFADKLFDPTGAEEEALASVTALDTQGGMEESQDSVSGYSNILTADPRSFVLFFSQVNVIKTDNDPAYKAQSRRKIMGNSSSCSPATRYTYSCPNAKFQCPLQSGRSFVIAKHIKACRFTSAEAVEAYAEARVHTCEQCGKSFRSKGDLQAHVKRMHDLSSKKCSVEGCSGEFQTSHALQKHVWLIHQGWTAKACPISGCDKSNHHFNFPDTFWKHLKSHGLTKNELEVYRLPPLRLEFRAQTCSFPGCSSKSNFSYRSRYKAHMENAHEITGEDYFKYEQVDS